MLLCISEVSEEDAPRVVEDHGRIVSLCIHRTDKLKTDFLIAHPVVRVTVVDGNTGNYLKKQHEYDVYHILYDIDQYGTSSRIF